MRPTLPPDTIRFLEADAIGGGPLAAIAGVSIDTRSLQPGDLFFALRGPRFDGHDFVGAAGERCAAAAVVARDRVADLPPVVPYLAVDDPLRALQRMAAGHRVRCGTRMVVITGSCGKTTTKEFCAAVLGAAGKVLKTRGNRNNEIGVPLTLLELTPEHDYAVIEVGTNHPGELDLLVELTRPEVGVITNVGPAHLEFFGDQQGVAREKSAAVRRLPADGAAILPHDDEFFPYLFGRATAPVSSFGFNRRAMFRASRVEMDWDRLRFLLHLPGGATARVHLPHPGRANVLNALAAAAVGHHCGVSAEAYLDGLARVPLPGWRSEVRRAGRITYYADCYNSNPQSMESALRTLSELPVRGRRVAVVCEMLELGPDAAQWHHKVGRQAALLGVDWLVAVGNAAPAADGAGAPGSSTLAEVAADNAEAIDRLRAGLREWDAVLIKGSRGVAPEEILNALAPDAGDGEA